MENILIVGGSSGIGAALVALLENQNATIYATFHRHATPNRESVFFQPLDVLSDEVALTDLPETLSGLVYCPGSIHLKPFGSVSEADLLADYKLQTVGAIKVIQHVLPKLKKSGNASIVLFSTVAVQCGFPFHSIVSASKGAIEGLTKALAAEFAPTIRVNAIAPSLTETPLAQRFISSPQKKSAQQEKHPLKKLGTLEEVAQLAAFLLSPRSAWMTGQILHLDGGLSTVKL